MIFLIINRNRNPKYSLYFIGGIVLEELKKENTIPIEVLLKRIRDKVDKNLHIDFLYYSLDWLFLLSLIRLKRNRIILC